MTAQSTSMTNAGQSFYAPWQEGEHAVFFDALADWSDSAIKARFESFNDVQLLRGHAGKLDNTKLLEIGCATGDLYRYISVWLAGLHYAGGDISVPAVERARAKYPTGRFFVVDPALSNVADEYPNPGILYCKDVVLHQTDPFGFLQKLVAVPEELAIIRLRTRDRGETVLDPEVSCQRHYSGWVPYMILNLDEMVARIVATRPIKRIEIIRNRMILGGLEGRFLPKDCYDPETGTAETAVMIEFAPANQAAGSPDISIHDRAETHPPYSFWQRARRQCRLRVPGARVLLRN